MYVYQKNFMSGLLMTQVTHFQGKQLFPLSFLPGDFKVLIEFNKGITSNTN